MRVKLAKIKLKEDDALSVRVAKSSW
jgi:hypothetical protein